MWPAGLRDPSPSHTLDRKHTSTRTAAALRGGGGGGLDTPLERSQECVQSYRKEKLGWKTGGRSAVDWTPPPATSRAETRQPLRAGSLAPFNPHQPVEALVDLLLVGESQHAADHSRVLDRPAQVADLGPTVSVPDLHHPLGDGQPLLGRGHHGPQPHLLDRVLVHLSLEITEITGIYSLFFYYVETKRLRAVGTGVDLEPERQPRV